MVPKARDGAPNVLILPWDDLGYATMDTFGGPVRSPNMKWITDRGVRFSNLSGDWFVDHEAQVRSWFSID